MKGLVRGKSRVSYENPIFSGSKVMIKVKLLQRMSHFMIKVTKSTRGPRVFNRSPDNQQQTIQAEKKDNQKDRILFAPPWIHPRADLVKSFNTCAGHEYFKSPNRP